MSCSQAAALVAAARDLAAGADQRYADADSAALAVGWTGQDLTALGFHVAATTNPRRRRATAVPEPQATNPGS